MTFEELSAHPTLLRALQQRGYEKPTPVQAAVMAPEHIARDLMVSAETGSGKTVAFGLAVANTLLGERATFDPPKRPRALVLAPTRELAMQVQRELAWLYHHAGMRSVACVGGMGMAIQLKLLGDGVHLVVGTPGRLCDHIERGALSLEDLEVLVIDEADEMLDMGFRDELERIIEAAPRARRTLMFSATLPPEIARLAKQWLTDPQRITATPPQQQHRDIEYRAHLIAPREREHAVVNVLRANEAQGSIVFCTTREAVTHLSASLSERGFACVAISGELSQPERTRALQQLRDGRARVLVATDVAARGLDLPDVGLVVQADLPNDPQALQHRSGRTGRAGRKGVSVILVPADRKRSAERLLFDAHIKPVWSDVPDAKAIRARDEAKLIEALTSGEAPEEEDLALARRVLEKVAPEQLAARLVALERQKLPDPEELPLTVRAIEAEKFYESRAPRPRFDSRYEPRDRRFGGPSRDDRYGAQRDNRYGAPRDNRFAGPPRDDRYAGPPRDDRGPPRGAPSIDSEWFTLNVGRTQNADPKWIIPVLCRRGGITKDDIGAIRVMEHETRVEIRSAAARSFEEAAQRPDRLDPRLQIERAQAAAPRPDRPPPRPREGGHFGPPGKRGK
ncbi:MAG: DEAD/DEAH box helicase [Polyangiales bacterium]